MSYKIVVARFNENINWLNSEMKNCIIYNKGNKLNIENEVILENLGRESDSYLHYIISNYDNLPDTVVFTQARIYDHIPRGINDINFIIKMKEEAQQYTRSQNYGTHYEGGRDPNLGQRWNLKNGNYFLSNNYKNNTPIIFVDWFKTHINTNYPNPFLYYSCGLFAVNKELILSHPIEYYKELILQVNHHINPAEGHFFERSWYNIFN